MKDLDYLGNKFVWFFGVVEDRNDPLMLGRVRVRCYYWHTSNKAILPTSSLPWAQCIMPNTSASISGIGQSPTNLVEGSLVIGFFLDGDAGQRPMIIGSIHGVPMEFTDNQYPTYIDEADTNRLVRNQTSYPVSNPTTKNNAKTVNVSIGNSDDTWDEPNSSYAAKYGNNHVTQTESGHIFEVDDTPGAERIHEYHKSGTFYEIDANGNKVTRIVGKKYEIVAGDDYVNIKGSCNITIDSNSNLHVKGDYNIEVDGNYNLSVKKNAAIEAARIDLN
jgi:hypothetical protein